MRKISCTLNFTRKKEISEFIAALPEDQQIVLTDYYEQNLSVKEIAIKMGCSTTSVYTKLNTAIFKLKTKFSPEQFEGAYHILYPETGKPITIASSTVSEYDQESNQNIV